MALGNVSWHLYHNYFCINSSYDQNYSFVQVNSVCPLCASSPLVSDWSRRPALPTQSDNGLFKHILPDQACDTVWADGGAATRVV
jgi:hypothetical protein